MLDSNITPHSMLAFVNPGSLSSSEIDILPEKLELLKKDLEKDALDSFQRLVTQLNDRNPEDNQKLTLVQDLVQKMYDLFKDSVKGFTKEINYDLSFDILLRDKLDFSLLNSTIQTADLENKERSFDRYQIQIDIPPDEVGMEWSGQVAGKNLSDNGHDEDWRPEYTNQHTIKLWEFILITNGIVELIQIIMILPNSSIRIKI
jgi:hypothetical protein